MNIARGDEQSDAPHLLVTQSAAERKKAFLKNAAGVGNIKRIDPKVSNMPVLMSIISLI